MKIIRLLLVFMSCYSCFAQVVNKNRVAKKILITTDTITLEKVAISPIDFVVTDAKKDTIPSNQYYFNPQKAQLYFYGATSQQIEVNYFKYPSFLTKVYSPFNKELILEKATPQAKTYTLKTSIPKETFLEILIPMETLLEELL